MSEDLREVPLSPLPGILGAKVLVTGCTLADHAEALPCLLPDPALPCHFPEALAWSSSVPGARSPAEQPKDLEGQWWADGRFFYSLCSVQGAPLQSGGIGLCRLHHAHRSVLQKQGERLGGWGWKVSVTMGGAGQCVKEMGLGQAPVSPAQKLRQGSWSQPTLPRGTLTGRKAEAKLEVEPASVPISLEEKVDIRPPDLTEQSGNGEGHRTLQSSELGRTQRNRNCSLGWGYACN